DLPNGERVQNIKDITGFLRWLNMHSQLPFLYKYRTLNGNNEFFIRLRNMYVHVRPGDLSADDGEREGQMTNNFTIEMTAEVRFPAPQMYAYYSDNEHQLTTVYGAWYQPYGPVSSAYTFKGTTIPDRNKYGWPLYMSTTYEDESVSPDENLSIQFDKLFKGDIGDCIDDCINKGISPSIFCDLLLYNGRGYVDGDIDWETRTFTSKKPVKAVGTFIGVYIDGEFINNFIIRKIDKNKERLKVSDKQYHEDEYPPIK
ncbi:MAG: hypothetical protein NC489_42675, partial [Ruminococcus flavefaciens]|nr:hypothetical protein [Ruminococcus flavefaciens]